MEGIGSQRKREREMASETLYAVIKLTVWRCVTSSPIESWSYVTERTTEILVYNYYA
jgi:hypothetical protein